MQFILDSSHGLYRTWFDPYTLYWSQSVSAVDILHEEPRGYEERNSDEKYDAKCVKLNNNRIEDAAELMSALEEIILQPAAVTWIDMSFNSLQKIDPVSEFNYSP